MFDKCPTTLKNIKFTRVKITFSLLISYITYNGPNEFLIDEANLLELK
jgi:hypothetical protein